MRKLVAIVACLTLIAGGSFALAKENGSSGHDNSDKSKKKNPHGEHHDNGRHVANGHHKFDSHDREVTSSWCHEHRENLPIGFRPSDRLTPQFEARLRVGVVLDVDLRKFVHSAPVDLVKRLPPPPVDLHYIAIGGHVGLLDSAHRLHDLLPLPPMPF